MGTYRCMNMKLKSIFNTWLWSYDQVEQIAHFTVCKIDRIEIHAYSERIWAHDELTKRHEDISMNEYEAKVNFQ